MKKFLEKITGLDKIKEGALKAQHDAEDAISKLKEGKMSPKEIATTKGEPWVGVLETHVNKDNPRNGFFELDWNDQFVIQLKQHGYGFDGDPDVEIVDRWFKDLARNILHDEDIHHSVGAGFLDFRKHDHPEE